MHNAIALDKLNQVSMRMVFKQKYIVVDTMNQYYKILNNTQEIVYKHF